MSPDTATTVTLRMSPDMATTGTLRMSPDMDTTATLRMSPDTATTATLHMLFQLILSNETLRTYLAGVAEILGVNLLDVRCEVMLQTRGIVALWVRAVEGFNTFVNSFHMMSQFCFLAKSLATSVAGEGLDTKCTDCLWQMSHIDSCP